MNTNIKKRTKIVATIGPASNNYDMLRKLAESGLNVARLNFSHGTIEEKIETINLVRRVSNDLKKPIAVLADMSGPKIRLGKFDGVVEVSENDPIVLSTEPEAGQYPMQYDLSPYLKVGQRVFLNDGLVELMVEKVEGKAILTHAINSGWFSEKKGVNVPDTLIPGAAFTDKDRLDARAALEHGVDYLAVSFIQSAEDLIEPRALINEISPFTQLVVKLEKAEAVKNLESIIKATDVMMVARGDLGIEIPATEVPIVQQSIIRVSRQNQKPVIVATQMLESMTENPRPTRAEVSDVANAVMDQVDAVMLSAESASGKYPVEAVSIMKQTILAVEANPVLADYIKIDWTNLNNDDDLTINALVSSAASIAYRIGAKAIIVPSVTGRVVRLLAAFRPTASIVAVVHQPKIYNQLSLIWGVRTVEAEVNGNFDQFLASSVAAVKAEGFASVNDKVVVVTGSTVGVSGSTDTIKVLTVH